MTDTCSTTLLKDCIYFDRIGNICPHYFNDWPPNNTASVLIYHGLRSVKWVDGGSDFTMVNKPTVNAASAQLMLSTINHAWLTHPEGGYRRNSFWTRRCLEFVQERPNGLFFVVTDHDDPHAGWLIKPTNTSPRRRPEAEYTEVNEDDE